MAKKYNNNSAPLDLYEKVQIYGDVIDPSITIELINTLEVGRLFPAIRGIATAHYAHLDFPDVPLEEAVKLHIKERDERKRRANISYDLRPIRETNKNN
jgi:hypothetical protein